MISCSDQPGNRQPEGANIARKLPVGPGIYEPVSAPSASRARADLTKAFTRVADKLLAICIQHEMDHSRQVFVDYLSRLNSSASRPSFRTIPQNRLTLIRQLRALRLCRL